MPFRPSEGRFRPILTGPVDVLSCPERRKVKKAVNAAIRPGPHGVSGGVAVLWGRMLQGGAFVPHGRPMPHGGDGDFRAGRFGEKIRRAKYRQL